jgi:hypothetical protein
VMLIDLVVIPMNSYEGRPSREYSQADQQLISHSIDVEPLG